MSNQSIIMLFFKKLNRRQTKFTIVYEYKLTKIGTAFLVFSIVIDNIEYSKIYHVFRYSKVELELEMDDKIKAFLIIDDTRKINIPFDLDKFHTRKL